jgi:hypothetical protein
MAYVLWPECKRVLFVVYEFVSRADGADCHSSLYFYISGVEAGLHHFQIVIFPFDIGLKIA